MSAPQVYKDLDQAEWGDSPTLLGSISLMDGPLREDSLGGTPLCPQGALSPFRETAVGHRPDDRIQVLVVLPQLTV